MEPACTRRWRAIFVILTVQLAGAIAAGPSATQEVEYPAGFDEEATYYPEALAARG